MNHDATRQKGQWNYGFLFLGNQLTLDLLNTRPVPAGEPIELLTDFAALLDWYRAGSLLSPRDAARLWRQWGKSDRAHQVVETVRELRERLRQEIVRWERGGNIRRTVMDALNSLMARHPMRMRLKTAGRSCTTELWWQAHEPEDLLAPLVYHAAELFASVDRSRVRKCDHCVAHFCDTSKKGSRRWCSMQLCGNRLKVAAYAARQRSLRDG
jgi:predicted RNA-binding Zn ribbon-like protein